MTDGKATGSDYDAYPKNDFSRAGSLICGREYVGPRLDGVRNAVGHGSGALIFQTVRLSEREPRSTLLLRVLAVLLPWGGSDDF